MPGPIDVWNTSANPPLILTYRFDGCGPAAPWDVYSGWVPFTPSEKAEIRSALAEYASVINVKFVPTTSAYADINFGRVSLDSAETGEGGYRYDYATNSAGRVTSCDLTSFALFSSALATIPRNIVLHEIGHALTLKHPGDYDAGGAYAPPPFLPACEDSNKYSVMSYYPDPDNGFYNPHLGLFDIAALQYRFGANLSYHTGNNTYTGPSGAMQVIWDAGGNDTISAAGRAGPVTINLNDGTFSSLGGNDNLAIAYGVIIENAVGGNGNDTLIGNRFSNLLSGGPGNDLLVAGAGADTLIGGPGNDTLIGGRGPDRFLFNATLSATTDVVTIEHFVPAIDKIALDHRIFTALGAPGALSASAFVVGTTAHNSAEHILYDRATGALTYDADGSGHGRACEFAKLAAGLHLSASDFLVI